MNVHLIYVEEKGTEKTHKMDTEESAKAFVISNIGSQPKDTLIKRIYVVDVDQGSMTELMYGLNDQILEFREK